jgi:hypothetical protein
MTWWTARLVVALVVVAVLFAVGFLFWHENERRYDALRFTGCFGDTGLSGVAQPCAGNVRRLCRDVPPLFDWRHFCQ